MRSWPQPPMDSRARGINSTPTEQHVRTSSFPLLCTKHSQGVVTSDCHVFIVCIPVSYSYHSRWTSLSTRNNDNWPFTGIMSNHVFNFNVKTHFSCGLCEPLPSSVNYLLVWPVQTSFVFCSFITPVLCGFFIVPPCVLWTDSHVLLPCLCCDQYQGTANCQKTTCVHG